MEIIPTIDVTPFLEVIDLALRAAWYTIVGVVVGAFIATVAIVVFGGDQE